MIIGEGHGPWPTPWIRHWIQASNRLVSIPTTELSEAALRRIALSRGEHGGLRGCQATKRAPVADGGSGDDGLSSPLTVKSRRVGLLSAPSSWRLYGGGTRSLLVARGGEFCQTSLTFSPKNVVVDDDCWRRRPCCCSCCWRQQRPGGDCDITSMCGWLPKDVMLWTRRDGSGAERENGVSSPSASIYTAKNQRS